MIFRLSRELIGELDFSVILFIIGEFGRIEYKN
jgi:hypothetical protein